MLWHRLLRSLIEEGNIERTTLNELIVLLLLNLLCLIGRHVLDVTVVFLVDVHWARRQRLEVFVRSSSTGSAETKVSYVYCLRASLQRRQLGLSHAVVDSWRKLLLR